MNETDSQLTKKFLEAFYSNKVCLHPTDTIPGITLNPSIKNFRETLTSVKRGRSLNKAPICLTINIEKAQLYWQPLPSNWYKALKEIWPAPLTVVWTASDIAPESICNSKAKTADIKTNTSNTVAIRVPEGIPAWLQQALEKVDFPMPSTSVNESGDQPITDWQKAVEFVSQFENSYCPSTGLDANVQALVPSTLIEIVDENSYKVLRRGSFNAQSNSTLQSKGIHELFI